MFRANTRYHHRFRLYDAEARMQFSDTIEVNTLELPKLPHNGDGTELGRWLQFLKADDEEALEMLAQNNPQIGKAVGVLKRLSADEETRILSEHREKSRRDFLARMEGAMEDGLARGMAEGLAKGTAEGLAKGLSEGALSIARNLLSMKMSIDDVVNATA